MCVYVYGYTSNIAGLTLGVLCFFTVRHKKIYIFLSRHLDIGDKCSPTFTLLLATKDNVMDSHFIGR